jgi:hypothetical protein
MPIAASPIPSTIFFIVSLRVSYPFRLAPKRLNNVATSSGD